MTEDELDALERRVMRNTRPEPRLALYYTLLSLGGLCLMPVLLVGLLIRYWTMWFRFDQQGVAMGYGLLVKREVQLTYARMQDIHLSQNLLERWLGLGTVTVQTAGSGAGGNVSIVGVSEYEGIRDYLYARMRGVRPGAAEPKAQADALLAEIRDALRDTARALEARGGSGPGRGD
jgi:uncharacterized protein